MLIKFEDNDHDAAEESGGAWYQTEEFVDNFVFFAKLPTRAQLDEVVNEDAGRNRASVQFGWGIKADSWTFYEPAAEPKPDHTITLTNDQAELLYELLYRHVTTSVWSALDAGSWLPDVRVLSERIVSAMPGRAAMRDAV